MPFVFVGFLANFNSYICLDMTNGRIVISIDVKFVEDSFSMTQHVYSELGVKDSTQYV